MSTLESLLEMGFDKERAEIAVQKKSDLQGALQWLEDNQDKPIDEIKAAMADDDEDEEETKAKIAALESGQAKSLVCNDCGKLFKNESLASFHASKTEHTDFSQSTEEIAPLTEEQKKEKLEELRERLQSKRDAQSVADKDAARANEKIRQKATKETQELKEELQRKEQMKEAQLKKQEKLDDMEAKRKIKEKIEEDKAKRKRKAEEAKALREGRAVEAAAAPAPVEAPVKPKVNHSEARLRLQTPSGNIIKTLPAETTLFELAQLVQTETGQAVTSFSTTFPRKVFEGEMDMSKTLKEAGMVPSAALVVK